MDIPAYPESRPLELADKPLLDGIFATLQPRISEFTFANLYLFRKAHAYRLSMVGDAPVLLGKGYDGAPYFLPPLAGAIGAAAERLLGEGMTLYGADETFLERHLKKDGLTVTEDRDNFDYLYLREELAELPGNRFHKKKNRISYFVARHAYVVEPYGSRHLEGCLGLLEEWARIHADMESASLALEVEATREGLTMASLIGLEGVVAIVEGTVKGFVLGERLNRETSACHLEKADPFLDGLYQLLDREFNSRLFTDCTYVNREQDLGEANLRVSKLSYHPVELVKKFRVRLQGIFAPASIAQSST
ncbi:MAG TPA: DUF2156 domain-containing protein [Geobacteraceae bacterium]|nr:DUF2156 domain-containing protein [Geobacteraceae bacterium]